MRGPGENHKKILTNFFFFFIVVTVVVVAIGPPAEPDNGFAFSQAINSAFALESRSRRPADKQVCRKSLLDLMARQGIPTQIASLRALSDSDLYRLALLAAVGGMSRWKRDDDNNLLFTEDGHLIHQFSPGAVESDVMLCLICALLTVIAIHHIVLTPPTSTQQH